MKRIFLITALICSSLIVLQSCAPQTITNKAAAKRSNVVGNWVLNDITLEGIPDVAVKSFLGENTYKCFLGSAWTLTNSGNGSYSLLTSANCAAKTQTIFWSVSIADETFQFKKIFEGEKVKNITDGYRMVLSLANANNMVIRSPVEFDNKTAFIVLNFARVTK